MENSRSFFFCASTLWENLGKHGFGKTRLRENFGERTITSRIRQELEIWENSRRIPMASGEVQGDKTKKS